MINSSILSFSYFCHDLDWHFPKFIILCHHRPFRLSTDGILCSDSLLPYRIVPSQYSSQGISDRRHHLCNSWRHIRLHLHCWKKQQNTSLDRYCHKTRRFSVFSLAGNSRYCFTVRRPGNNNPEMLQPTPIDKQRLDVLVHRPIKHANIP